MPETTSKVKRYRYHCFECEIDFQDENDQDCFVNHARHVEDFGP